ncbi:hypothetical protein SAMN05216196_103526 [Lutimaribacter pacificus]|uniref:Uncharacterized protein n=1 Tax=Lutimaribacter pacificus TaxID=391948 RepID=A0A1H0H4I1_9RHOB|nr:hypothetical protein SAMN05216196_103526 [Lutimaribacter pacificus]SHJ96144.1 hypothetical protein SAMN05444142_102527 [Lutimaribacter pacificus]
MSGQYAKPAWRCPARPRKDMRGGPVSRILSKGSPPLDGHSSKGTVAGAPPAAYPIPWARTCPAAISVARSARAGTLFGIAPGGACRAGAVASPPVGSYPTVSPFPRTGRGSFISVALSVRFPCPGVTRHRRLVESGLSSWVCTPAAIRPSAHSRTYVLEASRSTGKRAARSCAAARMAGPSDRPGNRARNASSIASGASPPGGTG